MKQNIKLLMWVTLDIIIAIAFRYGFEVGYSYLQDYFNWTLGFTTVSRTFLTAIVVLIWVAIVIRSEYTINKLPWLIILTLEPFIGLGLFLTFGRSYQNSLRYKLKPLSRPKKYLLKEPKTPFEEKDYKKIDSEITDIYKAAFNATGHHAYIHSNEVTVLTNGAEKFPSLIQDLKQAQSFILMQYYIIRTDIIGHQVLDILKEKAKSNCEVYLLYDAIGSVFLDRSYIKDLKKSKIKVVRNEPVFFGFFNTKVNYRNHRKVTIIDGKVGYVGGMNLADEYNNTISPFGFFRDTHLRIEGSAVQSLTQLFFRDWYQNTRKLINDERFYPTYELPKKGLVQIVPSGPEFKNPPIRNMYVKMINNAKQSIKIMTPYIALDQEILTSLVIAVKSGVKIDIIIPGVPDKKSVYQVTKSFIEPLIEEGVNIYFYKGGFTHAKVFIIDDHLASCGTYNLDNRSARINFEVTVLLYQTGVSQLISDFNQDLQTSQLIDLKKWRKRPIQKRFIEGLFNLFSPLV